MHKKIIVIGTLCCALAVALGAFGAHALKSILTPESLQSFHTATNYQMLHGIAIVLVGILHERFPQQLILWAARFFGCGILSFSGSIYLLTFLKQQAIGYPTFIVLVTPLGGLLMILGWLCLAWTFLRK